MVPRFVVVGTGRHGSRYLAELLSSAGIPTGHEAWWNADGTAKSQELIGDSSWLAVAHLDGYTGSVFHQVRDPLHVVNSLLRVPEPPAEDAVRRRALGGLSGSVAEQAVQIVLHWRRMCDSVSTERWRIEDLVGDVVLKIAANAGLPIDPDRVIRALEQTPKDLNAHGDGPMLGWDHIPPGPDRTALMRSAEMDGYL